MQEKKEDLNAQDSPDVTELSAQTDDGSDRRRFLKGAAITAASLIVGEALTAEAQQIKMNTSADDPKRTTSVRKLINQKAIPINNTAIVADGSQWTRAQILEKLNLNPNTPPDAWLAIVACGSNASALNFKDAEILVNKGVLDKGFLNQIRTGPK